MSKVVTTIQFSSDEKERFLRFLKEKQSAYVKHRETIEREVKILNAVAASVSSSFPNNFIDQVMSKITEWSTRDKKLAVGLMSFNSFIKAVTENTETEVNTDCRSSLVELYEQEIRQKAIDPMYTYYPRLKRAKEASTYEFAEKIKTVMESSNVKVA